MSFGHNFEGARLADMTRNDPISSGIPFTQAYRIGTSRNGSAGSQYARTPSSADQAIWLRWPFAQLIATGWGDMSYLKG
jgi:hypothetical protein